MHYRDSLGNTYSRCINGRAGQPHKAKPSSGGNRKWDKSDMTWRQKARFREATHRKWGHRFTPID
jgi:hypothetical protein